MSSNTTTRKTDHGLFRWSGAILLIYLTCYGSQLFFDFLHSDDYGVLADPYDPIEIKQSGRLIYYHALLYMREYFTLSSENLTVLRIISLFLQVSFFITLFVHLSTKLNVRTPQFFAIIILATLPQIQIFSVWLVTLPYWVLLNLILLSIILTDRLSQCQWWLRILSGMLGVITIVITLLVNQLFFFVAISLFLVSMLAKAVRNEPWLNSFIAHIVAVGLGLGVYLLILTLDPDTIGYTGYRADYVQNLVKGSLGEILAETLKSSPKLSFHIFNGVFDSKTSVIFWLPLLGISIFSVGHNLFSLWRRSNSAFLIPLLGLIYTLYLLFCLYTVPMLNSHKGAYRMYFPATLLIWGALAIGLNNLWQITTNKYPRITLIRFSFIVICSLALANASYSVHKGIILPMTNELSYIKEEIKANHTKNHRGVFLRMPQSEAPWLHIEHGPSEGLFSIRLSTYFPWVPRGMLRYALNSVNIEGWEHLELRKGRQVGPPNYSIIDMRLLEATIYR